jgi:hypothetical protein
MATLGVMAHPEPLFVEVGYEIPGTGELMLSTHWGLQRSPYFLKNGRYRTSRGAYEFDSSLFSGWGRARSTNFSGCCFWRCWRI